MHEEIETQKDWPTEGHRASQETETQNADC